MTSLRQTPMLVIPAKAGNHLAVASEDAMDSRFRGNDGFDVRVNDGAAIVSLNGKHHQ